MTFDLYFLTSVLVLTFGFYFLTSASVLCLDDFAFFTSVFPRSGSGV